jgi:hypothetical protein
VRFLVRPNEYNLGSTVEIDTYPTDLDDNFFVPQESRLSIKEPDGDLITVSGDGLTTASGYMYYLYKPEQIGWFQYEFWHKEGDRETAKTNGFEVTDRVY